VASTELRAPSKRSVSVDSPDRYPLREVSRGTYQEHPCRTQSPYPSRGFDSGAHPCLVRAITDIWLTASRQRAAQPAALDALLEEALATVDDEKRSGLLQQATEIGIGDAGIIPLHYEVTFWGMRGDLTFEGNTSQYTQAFDIHSVKK
jgi:ABC-type transport system substrate-binding protein